MNLLKGAIILLTVVYGSLAVDFSRFLWTGKPTKTAEEAQLIEMVRWRQPVCLMPAEGVYPCSHEIKKYQKQYEQFSGKILDLGTEDPSTTAALKSSLLINDEDVIKPESSATPPISESFVEQSSDRVAKGLTESEQEMVRGQRHMHIMDKKKIQPIYVTKVLNSPMTATLVAYGCLPDVGLPLCQNYQPPAPPAQPGTGCKPPAPVTEKPVIDQKPANGPCCCNGGTNKPGIVVKYPNNEQPSTKFIFEETSTFRSTSADESTEAVELALVNEPTPPRVNIYGQTSLHDQSVKTELTIKVSKDAAEDVDAPKTLETDATPKKNEHKFLQTIRDIVNKTEHSKIVQSIQNIFRKKTEPSSTGFEQKNESSEKQAEDSSASDEQTETSTLDSTQGSSNYGNRVEIDDVVRYEDNGNATKMASDDGATSDKMELVRGTIVVEDLRKPLMDRFEVPGEKLTEKHGLFGDASKK